MEKCRSNFKTLVENVVSYLRMRRDVCEIEISENDGCEKSILKSWQVENECLIPEDLQGFLSYTNGLQIRWAVEDSHGMMYPLGRISIYDLQQIECLSKKVSGFQEDVPGIDELESDSSDDEIPLTYHRRRPSFTRLSRIFIIDSWQGSGHMCIVYKPIACNYFKNNPYNKYQKDPEIWLLDSSIDWHFIASNFSTYFIMCMKNLGLPAWHHVMTEIGLTKDEKYWMKLFTSKEFSAHIDRLLKLN